MDSYEKAERKRQARHRLHAQKARAGRLRNRVIAISLVCFALLWGAVFVQMATGNDPVLGRSATKTATAARSRPAETKVEPEVETEVEPAETEIEPVESEVEAELEAEIAQAEAESAEAEATEFEAAEEELEPVTSGQS
jgi:hypothetical protein